MKRDFLESLKLDAEAINKIMAENGRDIENAKAKFADYEDVKKQLADANATIEKFADYDQTKADVEKYKAEALNAQKEAAAKIAQLEIQAKVKDFTGGKKFVNDLTRDAINQSLEKALGDDASKGKSLDDLFREVIEGKENILVNEDAPKPPVTAQIGGQGSNESGVMAAFKALNPNIKF